jgi:hypothetical protein
MQLLGVALGRRQIERPPGENLFAPESRSKMNENAQLDWHVGRYPEWLLREAEPERALVRRQ